MLLRLLLEVRLLQNVNKQQLQSFMKKIQNKISESNLKKLTHLTDKYLLESFSLNLIANAPEKYQNCE
jgi:hypothetical protein